MKYEAAIENLSALGPCREADFLVARVLDQIPDHWVFRDDDIWWDETHRATGMRYTGSLDWALQLCKSVFPYGAWTLDSDNCAAVNGCEAYGKNAAIALCAAVLEAKAYEEVQEANREWAKGQGFDISEPAP